MINVKNKGLNILIYRKNTYQVFILGYILYMYIQSTKFEHYFK